MFVTAMHRRDREDVASVRPLPGLFEVVLALQQDSGDPWADTFAIWVFARRSDKTARERWERRCKTK